MTDIVVSDGDSCMMGDFWRIGPQQDIDIQAILSSYSPDDTDTVTLTGNIEAKEAMSAALVIAIYNSSNVLQSTLFSGSVNLAEGSNDIPTLAGAALSFDCTGETPDTYYFRVEVTVASESELAREDLNFVLTDIDLRITDNITLTVDEIDDLDISVEILR